MASAGYIDTIGPVATKEIFFTARQFGAEEALRWSVLNHVVADEALESSVMDTANTIAGNAPLSIRCVKVSTIEVLKDPGDRNLARSTEAVAACFASSDYIEGRDAFLEKRKPNFTGS